MPFSLSRQVGILIVSRISADAALVFVPAFTTPILMICLALSLADADPIESQTVDQDSRS
ncbi:MAG: hypothetical protein IH969_02550 [Candidatus Krumholzibacteriota bacterium]|nr:hypothetical protein [Candidatus Krumholzibacteriota bacterium]